MLNPCMLLGGIVASQIGHCASHTDICLTFLNLLDGKLLGLICACIHRSVCVRTCLPPIPYLHSSCHHPIASRTLPGQSTCFPYSTYVQEPVRGSLGLLTPQSEPYRDRQQWQNLIRSNEKPLNGIQARSLGCLDLPPRQAMPRSAMPKALRWFTF
jgi:hypothetical protein